MEEQKKGSVQVSESKGLPDASADTQQRLQHQLKQTQILISPPPSTRQLIKGATKDKEITLPLGQTATSSVSDAFRREAAALQEVMVRFMVRFMPSELVAQATRSESGERRKERARARYTPVVRIFP